MFTTLQIENFRGFGDLRLEGLGRVNLIVGKNNTGKTSLLEAITLLASPSLTITQLPHLFRATAKPIGVRFYPWLIKDAATANRASLLSRSQDGKERRVVLTKSPEDITGLMGLWGNPELNLHGKNLPALRVHAVSVEHQEPDSMVDAFAEAVRAPLDEQQMEKLLASVDPRIKSIRLDAVGSRPFIVVDIGLINRVPLPQIGQGVYRLVAIFSELLGRKPNICFIDEIENGIHYSALPAVWRGIAEVAARLDIQVFATTHSWECLLAAHEAFAPRETYDLRVVQLYRLDDAVSGRVLDRAHIEAAIAGEIELR